MRLDTKPGQRTHYADIRRQLVLERELSCPLTIIIALGYILIQITSPSHNVTSLLWPRVMWVK